MFIMKAYFDADENEAGPRADAETGKSRGIVRAASCLATIYNE